MSFLKNLIVILVVTTIFISDGNIPVKLKALAQTQDVNINPYPIDSDVDGLTNDSETTIYKTDANKWDTDLDSFSDGQEVIEGSNPININETPITLKEVPIKEIITKEAPIAWYLSRASGITAFILFSIGVCFGMSISSKSYFKILKPPVALEIHNTIALIALGATVIHFGSLFFDHYLKLKVIEMLVPFALVRNFKSASGFDLNFAVALGIFAFYLTLIQIITSEFRAKLSIKVWRTIHFASFITYFLFLAHGIMSGSDSNAIWMQSIYLISVFCFLLMLGIRIRSAINISRARKLKLQQKAQNQTSEQSTVLNN